MLDANAVKGSVLSLSDLMLVSCTNPGRTCAESGVMLARARPSGIFELLTAAWAQVLGYGPEELSGKPLCELVDQDRAAGDVAAALFDEEDVQPLDVTLRCKDERRMSFRFHRRFDSYEKAIFVVADELSQSRAEPRST